ncbi:hypothetical protein PAXINDRAFT_90695 [Paxillus involutus ATCC 200175]|uniref:C2H2-type domain-containing protein n=1 Tax=Paxillus involutus ATCC 200175 TaxID=664439 RepID=A0A0C9TH04_PAXIN|nr:hypothetical protein PAXINDRAFT_90695 [Paxillus involutus ATCC 200175]
MPPARHRHNHNSLQIPCGKPGCQRWFKSKAGRTRHHHSAHPDLPPSVRHNRGTPQPDPPPPRTPTPVPSANEAELQNLSPPPHSRAPSRSLSPEGRVEFHGHGDRLYRNYHPKLDGRACNELGEFLAPGMPPPLYTERPFRDWAPYRDRVEFELAEFLFKRNQMSASQIDTLLDLWAATLLGHGKQPPFANHHDLYKVIDSTPLGSVPWKSFSVTYNGEKPDHNVPPWMNDSFEVWYRDPHEVIKNMLGNADYKDEMDYAPFHEFSSEGDEQRWQDFMSGSWAWSQADEIAKDPDTHGATFVPIVLGSDKTTVSVGTGNNEYYPLYISLGNVRNNVRRAHRDAVSITAFLAIPKTTKEHANDSSFRKFRRQLFHSSLAKILGTFKPWMTKPEIVQFGDSYHRRVIYGLGPYIADYEEQVLLSCIVRGWCAKCLSPRNELDINSLCRCKEHTETLLEQATLQELWSEYGIVGDLVPFTNDFPRADIHELLSPDILHQLIKGTFKDHLVDWVERYLKHVHSAAEASRILDDIDRRIATVAPCAGLRRFPQGRGFKQWTGDDSKALMKVYLPAIEGYVPTDVVQAFRAFLDFCYLVRRDVITEHILIQIQDALERFHHHRTIFNTLGIVLTFSLPRQHSMVHYLFLIRLFGAPNGLCSSITEAKHIKAVKEPWRRSSRFKALGQMLLTNQRLDKLSAARADFRRRRMLDGTCLSEANVLDNLPDGQNEDVRDEVQLEDNNEDIEVDNGPTSVLAHVELAKTPQYKRARTVNELAVELLIPQLPVLLGHFLFAQLHPDDERDPDEIPPNMLPHFNGRIWVFNSASSRFFAPSDLSGIKGMRREHIRACPRWRNDFPRYDCIFTNTNPELDGMAGMTIARVICFFSFKYDYTLYPCAIVRWFDTVGDAPDEDTGMWMVRPAFHANHTPNIAVIHIDAIYRAAHLIPIYGRHPVPLDIKYYHSYDTFRAFYVNKYADHHAFEIAF